MLARNITAKPHTVYVLTNSFSSPPFGLLMAYSVGGSQVAGAALLECADTVGERWFCRGALRGRSPCTREGACARPPKIQQWEEKEHLCSPRSGLRISCGCVDVQRQRTDSFIQPRIPQPVLVNLCLGQRAHIHIAVAQRGRPGQQILLQLEEEAQLARQVDAGPGGK